VAKDWWRSLDEFVSELPGADNDQLLRMHEWARRGELSATMPGRGRNPKARRYFRQMRAAAEAEMQSRGVDRPDFEPAEESQEAGAPSAMDASARGKARIMYIEAKPDRVNGPARIGRVWFSKTGRTVYYQGRAFQSLKGGGFKANYYDVATGEEFWISGPKKDGGDRLHGQGIPVEIDDDVREEYWRDIRGLPDRSQESVANR